MKKFKLLHDVVTPTGITRTGTVKTFEQWLEIFPDLHPDDMSSDNWFEPAKVTHNDRYAMSKEDQTAQIDCRRVICFHHEDGRCLNISPAITVGYSGSNGKCWSFNERFDDGDAEDTLEEFEDEEIDEELEQLTLIETDEELSMREKWNKESLYGMHQIRDEFK